MKIFPSYSQVLIHYGNELLSAPIVKTTNWQSTEVHTEFRELFGVSFKVPMLGLATEAAMECFADTKWADLHFTERISGLPLNPGSSYKIWPYYGKDEVWREDEKFSHTYMERIWPKMAGYFYDSTCSDGRVNRGIRFEYGDLDDVIKLLAKDPDTRQAYLPIWFPEDTGVVHNKRVPCTLGYLFNIRNEYLHCTYYIRSCDYIRHFHNDLYLTNRLAEYVREIIARKTLRPYKLGFMYFHCQSLHIFKNDEYGLKKRVEKMDREASEWE